MSLEKAKWTSKSLRRVWKCRNPIKNCDFYWGMYYRYPQTYLYHIILYLSICRSIYLPTWYLPIYLFIYIYTNYIIKYISMYIYIRWTCEHILTLRFAALILTLGVGTSSRHCCSWLVWRWAKQRLAITTAHSSPFSSPWNRGDLPPIIPKCLAILVLKAMVTWGCPIFRKPHISGRFQRSWTPMDHDPRLWLDPAV